MKAQFYVNHPRKWLENLANQLDVEVCNNTVFFPNNIGEGFLRHYYLSNSLTLNYMKLKTCRPFSFLRHAGAQVPYSPVHFYFDNNTVLQQIDGDDKKIGPSTPNGIFWPSAKIQTQWDIPVGKWLANIVVIISHDWLLSLLDYEDDCAYIRELLMTDKSFYFFEDINISIDTVLKELVTILENEQHQQLQAVFLEAKATELIGYFIEKIIRRQQKYPIVDLNKSDIEQLFRVKSNILNNLSGVPSVNELAQQELVSVSKLQRNFKQVFGKSIYQYALYEKMMLAQKMLRTKRYTVSEVGYFLGYSNLSHFTNAFRKQFGVNPKDFNQS